jgi:hypothetical protein
VIKFDELAPNINPWNRPTALAGCFDKLAVAVDDKCVRVVSVQDIMAKESTAASFLVKRPPSEKLSRDDESKRKKAEEEKPLFSIMRSRVFYQ